MRSALAELPAAQQPEWGDASRLADAVAELRAMPPLVFAGECDLLKQRLAAVSRGEAFLLQGGDCAETFDGITADNVRAKLKTLLQMAVVLTYAASMPVVKVGRLAGQYAKPRSKPSETRDGETLPAFRGDIVNGVEFTEQARTPDPARMVRAYNASAAALNLTRAFVGGGFADLHQVHAWNTDFVRTSPAGQRYERIAGRIDQALRFMRAIDVDSENVRKVELYSSHEALLLDYETALTRVDSRTGAPYDVSGHFLWVGERTRQLDGAHIEFASRIRNPIGVKVGPKTTSDDLIALAEKLDPEREPGRLTFVTRMGAEKIRDGLPPLIEKAMASGLVASWVCDPMHGNTYEAPSGHKTRRFDDVMDEVRGFFEVHRSLGSHPGGLHVELTGDDVTECVGGGDPIAEDGLSRRYETVCDPRLNRTQSLELAFLVAELLETTH
ncbi:3-deoxy-7-phosphoheptulonate synthase class II [Actinobacteria bacterium YIM 96077]|uniref:Phospho-2-dehydro-3-deoxyheptonate aldolase n=1 Tax=Phytoactinopolyspora halophila TaxID=1981511 RepID=A0A329QFX4_9ACTN|nr:3-deoxy-7-phosphoheptulonate synthase class II [Actinobacteria bacterium YIM 96077]RAW11267.1 3-deoxy-7-phosphoheptulonate synthase class II [Phytoactinopolyspora halophila]